MVRTAIMLALMLAGAAPADARWRRADSAHFVIYSEQQPAVLRLLATRMERFDAGMRLLFPLPPTIPGKANRLTIYVVPNDAAVQKLYGAGSHKGGFGVSGFYNARAGGSIAFVPASSEGGTFGLTGQIVLMHEYAHHLMMAGTNVIYPAWYREGFAEFCSTTKIDHDNGISFGVAALHRAYGLILGSKIPIERLFSHADEKLAPELHESLYGRGWLLTHYLTFSDQRRSQLNTYIQALNKGTPGLEAARIAFGDLKQLDKELDVYLDRPKMAVLTIPAGNLKVSSVELSELSDGEDAIMPVRMRSKRGVDAAAAKALVPIARRLAAPYSKDAAAQLALTEVEFDARNDTEAEAAADRTLALDPQSNRAMLYKAWVAIRRANAAHAAAGDPLRRTARAEIVKANRADPDDPQPLISYYTSFIEAGEKPTRSAIAGLARAYQLAPQDLGLSMSYARQVALDGDFAEARAVLAPISYDPHGEKLAAVARTVVDLIDQKKTGEIAALLKPGDATTEEPASPRKPKQGG